MRMQSWPGRAGMRGHSRPRENHARMEAEGVGGAGGAPPGRGGSGWGRSRPPRFDVPLLNAGRRGYRFVQDDLRNRGRIEWPN